MYGQRRWRDRTSSPCSPLAVVLGFMQVRPAALFQFERICVYCCPKIISTGCLPCALESSSKILDRIRRYRDGSTGYRGSPGPVTLALAMRAHYSRMSCVARRFPQFWTSLPPSLSLASTLLCPMLRHSLYMAHTATALPQELNSNSDWKCQWNRCLL